MIRNGPAAPVTLLGLLLAVTACGPDEIEPTPFASTDSAGVLIAQSSGAAWAEGSEWTLSPDPELEIGAQTGDPDYLLS